MQPSPLSALGRRARAPAISWLMRMTLERPRLISLAAGFTDNESLPVAETRALVEEVLRQPRKGQAALQYGSTAGDPELRRLTGRRLVQLDRAALHPFHGATRRGFSAEAYDPERILITNGSQQLLYLVTEALCDPGDFVLVEDPTYFVYLGIAQSHGLRCRGVHLEEDGINLAHLDEVLAALKRRGELRRVKLLYLVSYYQNPTGITTSFAKKAAVLELLRQYERAAGRPIYVLEDAAYRELRFAADDTPSALAVRGGSDRVIYAGTYSKPFATGIRVGFGVLPEPLCAVAQHLKGNHDFGTANLLQQVLARALRSGRYERHLAALRRRYAHKAGVMTAAIRRHFPLAVEWEEPEGGLYVWARVPPGLACGTDSKLFQASLRKQVLYVPGELCYAEDSTRRRPDHEMRLSFGGAREADIRQGIARLGGVLRRFVR